MKGSRIHQPESTNERAETPGELFDAVVIGAGPAGATSAYLLGRAGYRVLLVDRQPFPRSKVCGCCLSGRGVAHLRHLGLADTLEQALPSETFLLACRGQQVKLQTHGGAALSRNLFDSALVEQAENRGVVFLDSTQAELDLCFNGLRHVVLKSPSETRRVGSRVVLLCSGLGQGRQLDSDKPERVAGHPLIGLTGIVPAPGNWPASTIKMAVSQAGYVGMVQLETGQLNVSAAIQRDVLKSNRNPAETMADILESAGVQRPFDLETADWQGTPALTRRLLVPAAERTFVVGDAAGYVEPFTGEGMTWAIEAAELVQPLATAAIDRWSDRLTSDWLSICRKHARRSQRCCRLLKAVLPHPHVVSAVIGGLRWFPQAASPVLKSIHGPLQKAHT